MSHNHRRTTAARHHRRRHRHGRAPHRPWGRGGAGSKGPLRADAPGHRPAHATGRTSRGRRAAVQGLPRSQPPPSTCRLGQGASPPYEPAHRALGAGRAGRLVVAAATGAERPVIRHQQGAVHHILRRHPVTSSSSPPHGPPTSSTNARPSTDPRRPGPLLSHPLILTPAAAAERPVPETTGPNRWRRPPGTRRGSRRHRRSGPRSRSARRCSPRWSVVPPGGMPPRSRPGRQHFKAAYHRTHGRTAQDHCADCDGRPQLRRS